MARRRGRVPGRCRPRPHARNGPTRPRGRTRAPQAVAPSTPSRQHQSDPGPASSGFPSPCSQPRPAGTPPGNTAQGTSARAQAALSHFSPPAFLRQYRRSRGPVSLWRAVPYSPRALLLHQFRTALHLPLLSCRYSEVLPCHLSQGPRRRAPHLLEGQQVGREEEHPPSSADGGTRQEEAPADITLSATLPRPETAQVPHSLQTSPAAETARGLPIDAEAFGPRDLWEATASSAPSRRLPRSPHQVHMAGHASRERALPHPRASARRRPQFVTSRARLRQGL